MYACCSPADSGIRSNADRDMTIPSQSPVAQRATNRAAPLALQVLAAGDQDAGVRVELEPFAGELLQHVVGHDDGGLAGQAEAAQLGHADDHFGGFAGPDLVGQQHGRLVNHPGDGGGLMRAGPERQGQAGHATSRRRRSCAGPGC